MADARVFLRPADRDPAASEKKVMLELLEKVRMLGVPPVSQCRTEDNVSTVGINLPHLRAEIKAIHESGATWHQRSAINAKGFQLEQRHPASSKEEEVHPFNVRPRHRLEADVSGRNQVVHHKECRKLVQYLFKAFISVSTDL